MVDLDVETYADLIAKWVHKLANQEIPILVLFTSKSLLLAVSERLRLPHLAQYKNGEAANIKRRFDRGETSILLGSGSFWEGTDFSSQKQMIEMITRILLIIRVISLHRNLIINCDKKVRILFMIITYLSRFYA